MERNLMENSFSFLLLGNSLLLLLFIFNQNESAKDSSNTQINSSIPNPFEQGTWVCFLLQLVLLLIQTKLTDI
jgi:hypothetical protein